MVAFTYDPLGLLTETVQGVRGWTFDYDSLGRLAGATDPLGRPDSIEYDLADRVTRQVLADGDSIVYGYVRGRDHDSADVRDTAAQALKMIREAGEPFYPLVLNELAFIGAVRKGERISRNLNAYFWRYPLGAAGDPTSLALGVIGAACYLRSAREAREARVKFDDRSAREGCHGLQESFARTLPDAELWLRRVRRWREAY